MKYALLLLFWPACLAAQSNEVTGLYFKFSDDSISANKPFVVQVGEQTSRGRYKIRDSHLLTISSDRGKMNGNEWIPPADIIFSNVHFRAFLNRQAPLAADTVIWVERKFLNQDNSVDMPLPVVPLPFRKR